MIEFEWDEAKRLSNIEKHEVDFEDAAAFFDGRAHVVVASSRNDEPRFAMTTQFNDRLYTVIWTPREGRIRIISIRRAWSAEERAYRQVHGRGIEGQA
jgi:uncharacterized DUF497 family protein